MHVCAVVASPAVSTVTLASSQERCAVHEPPAGVRGPWKPVAHWPQDASAVVVPATVSRLRWLNVVLVAEQSGAACAVHPAALLLLEPESVLKKPLLHAPHVASFELPAAVVTNLCRVPSQSVCAVHDRVWLDA